jgi:uncharacterized protein
LFDSRQPGVKRLKREEIMINKDLLEILACPQCKGPVKLKDDEGLVCEKCMLLYEIKDDIPIMLIDKAKKIEKID